MNYKIITEADLYEFTDVTESFNGKEFEKKLQDVQELDLKGLLGSNFYLDILQNLETEKYTDILNPKIWTYEDYNYSHNGLKIIVANFLAARYYQSSTSFSSPFGNRQMNNDFSTASPEKEVARLANEARSKALAYFDELKTFLIHNNTDYPLFLYEKMNEENKQSIRITAIGGSYNKLSQYENE